jgi:hypothetical protein
LTYVGQLTMLGLDITDYEGKQTHLHVLAVVQTYVDRERMFSFYGSLNPEIQTSIEDEVPSGLAWLRTSHRLPHCSVGTLRADQAQPSLGGTTPSSPLPGSRSCLPQLTSCSSSWPGRATGVPATEVLAYQQRRYWQSLPNIAPVCAWGAQANNGRREAHYSKELMPHNWVPSRHLQTGRTGPLRDRLANARASRTVGPAARASRTVGPAARRLGLALPPLATEGAASKQEVASFCEMTLRSPSRLSSRSAILCRICAIKNWPGSPCGSPRGEASAVSEGTMKCGLREERQVRSPRALGSAVSERDGSAVSCREARKCGSPSLLFSFIDHQ